MTRSMPFYVVLAAALCVLSGFFYSPDHQPDAVTAFGRIPVLSEGRIKPLDSVARNTLLVIQARQRVMTPDNVELTPDEWLLDALFVPEKADTYRVFVIDNTDLLSLVGKTDESLTIHYDSFGKQVMALVGFLPSRQRRLSFNEIAPHLADIEAQEKLAEPVEAQTRTRFQAAVVQLYGNLSHYVRLRHALVPEGSKDFLSELMDLQGSLTDGIAAVRAKEAGKPHDEAKAQAAIIPAGKFVAKAGKSAVLALPNADDEDRLHMVTAPAGRLAKPSGRASVEPGLGASLRRNGLCLAPERAREFRPHRRALWDESREAFPRTGEEGAHRDRVQRRSPVLCRHVDLHWGVPFCSLIVDQMAGARATLRMGLGGPGLGDRPPSGLRPACGFERPASRLQTSIPLPFSRGGDRWGCALSLRRSTRTRSEVRRPASAALPPSSSPITLRTPATRSR